MKFASACRPFIERIEKILTRVVNEAVTADKSKIYINTISEIKSFIESFKIFLGTVKLLEEFFPDMKVGRPCFRWIYSEEANVISLVRLESSLSMIFTGELLRITYNDKSITLYESPRISITLNQYNDDINLEDEDNVTIKRSLILNVISTIRDRIEKSIENLSLCVKYVRVKSG